MKTFWQLLFLCLTLIGVYLIPENFNDQFKNLQLNDRFFILKKDSDLFKNTRPSVVNIVGMKNTQETGIGTGFFITNSKILTAYHVISDSKLIKINTLNGEKYSARLFSYNTLLDLALLEINSKKEFPYLKISKIKPKKGNYLLGIGNSDGDFLQPREGYLISENFNSMNPEFPKNSLEMSNSLRQGDSGGPIINEKGEVVGVTSYIRFNNYGQVISSHAVPITAKSSTLLDLIKGKNIDKGAIGFVFDSYNENNILTRVIKNSPADMANFQAGDEILAINNQNYRTKSEVIEHISNLKEGEKITVTFKRNNLLNTIDLVAISKRDLLR